MRVTRAFKHLDWTIVITASLLVLIGLAMVFSASYDTSGVFSYRFVRQVAAAGIGLFLFFLISNTSYRFWRRYAIIIYCLGLISLVYVGISAQIIRGSASRLQLFGVQVQPSEFMRVALVLLLAYIFAKATRPTLRLLAISLMVTVVPVVFVLLEPDAGMAALLVGLWFISVIFFGFPWRLIAAIISVGLVLSAISWQALLLDYQKDRLLTFIDPSRDPLGAGYNVTQSIIALGSGQFAGRGLGTGPQSRLQFLPEQHTDFIFASIGEELGFVGVAIVISLYVILLWRIIRISQNTEDSFGRLVAVGVFSLLITSFTVSAGMNIGLLPVTGIALPLVSYGGSSLISTFILLGIVQSVATHNEWNRQAPGELSQFT